MRAWAGLYAKGLAMGLADLVPGVSGGTIAFISGIYDELVATIAGLDRRLLGVLREGGVRGVWQAGNLSFLAVLLAGIGTSVFAFAGLLHWLLANRPVELRAFFFGLVAASVLLVGRRVADRRAGIRILAAAGAVLAAVITSLPPLVRSDAPLLLAAAAAVAACAMVLPGISGAFILLLLGAYAPVIAALHSLDLVRLAFVSLGIVAGLLAFSRVLRRLLARHRTPTLAVLTGFLVGSLNALWPWKVRIRELYTHSDGRIEWLRANRWPEGAAEIWPAVALALLGAVAVLAIERIAGPRGPGRP
ncbi:DUF368 domain-containing protein [Candidatus Palauibacter polyketidifaciens]|uniref:DUF368 domain-containing protein n=1 Tax=Candidatus Palauibacter polyketidifaciens TaxID=3056740 RepID=UPI00239C4341|nr:DUF368 domain-containing protein [Candidatus Palauibacter polyketidifaciens]MDE2721373.1 DUF368 domain-containing protein [Candidatus Palauibacter polyketidifaciens]